jgi:hypothetical protein
MFGPRITTVFQSRWKALVWSLSILATAYCAVPAVDSARQQDAAKPAPQHKSPWAKEG